MLENKKAKIISLSSFSTQESQSLIVQDLKMAEKKNN